MFELKYKITDADMKAVNKRIMWQFFIPYVIVALLGVAAGITAVVLQPHNELFVLGIILIVLASALLVCAVFMAIAPKNFVVSALLTDENVERTFEIGENGVTVKTPEQSDITVDYAEILKVKDKKNYALLYVGKDAVILMKDAIVSGGTFAELVSFVKEKTVKSPAKADGAQTDSEQAPDAEPAPAQEKSDGAETENGQASADEPEPATEQEKSDDAAEQ